MTFALTDKELISAATDAGFVYGDHGGLFNSYIEGVDIGSHVLSFARGVIAADRARFGRPAIEPEERWYPSFADWLEREMPEGTVIGDPLWWASKIATYLQRHARPAIKPVPTPEPGTADHITDDEGTRWDRTMDAALWAKAFCLICPEMASREDVMIGWFANAIMAGCDHQAWKMDAERKPVPVGERLPGLEDCDTRGRCWFIDDDEKWCPVILGDILDEDEPDAIQRVICYYGYTHWLPYWALPVPTSQEAKK